jgi:hypothetical protein
MTNIIALLKWWQDMYSVYVVWAGISRRLERVLTVSQQIRQTFKSKY